MSPCGAKASSRRLENIEEESPTNWPGESTCARLETPTESMEFLARSWSLSAAELSKALSTTHTAPASQHLPCLSETSHVEEDKSSKETPIQRLPCENSPPTSPRSSVELKELLLHDQECPTGQQLLKNGVYKSIVRGKTRGRWVKDQKKQEVRTQSAQLHAAVSVAGVAAAVAASTVTLAENSGKTSAAIVSAAALVASHCIDIAEEMGADHDHILSVVNSAINARTNGDIMALTAGAATALRGAATLKARLLRGPGATAYALYEEKGEESNIYTALNFVCRGGELLKLTRKGDLHWKQVSFSVDSNGQVLVKMKSKHMAGTFTKKKKCVVTRVYYDVPVWPGKENERSSEQRAYFGIKTEDRIIQFECKSKGDKQIWIEGIRVMLHYRATIT